MNYLISITGIQSDEIHVLYLISLHTKESKKAQTTRRPLLVYRLLFSTNKISFSQLKFPRATSISNQFPYFHIFFTSFWFPFGNYLLLNIATDFISNFLSLFFFTFSFLFIEQTCLHHLPLLSHLSQF